MKAILNRDQKQPVYKTDMIIERSVGKQMLPRQPVSYSVT